MYAGLYPIATSVQSRGALLPLERPVVMGILNTTPDSFHAASRHAETDDAVRTAERMLIEGAAILDIGGQSTRPGAAPVDAAEEERRVVPVVAAVARRFPNAWISVDTYHSAVARAAVEAGARIVNDVSGGAFDAAMLSTVAGLGVPYVAMHMQGTPQTMQHAPHYADVVADVFAHLAALLQRCSAAGIGDVVLDVGFGFRKTAAHNFSLMRYLASFRALGCPLLVGVSRKGMVHRTLGISAEEALNGTTVLHTAALLAGASILRAHDVKEAVEAVNLCTALQEAA